MPRPAALVESLGGPGGLRFHRAPGRVNLIGDHTDYQDGLCLPLAIDREVLIAGRPGGDSVTVRSLDLAGAVTVPADGSADPATVDPAWGRTVAAVVRVLAGRGRSPVGLDAAVSSTVPVGSGLSSSAAFEVALALALADAAGFTLAGQDLARAAQASEHLASGVPCGLMDQMAAVFGRAGHALLLDCRSLEVEALPLPASLAVVVVHSGLPRVLASSEYAARRAECEADAARLGLAALRDATPAQVSGDRRARHVVSENARVEAFAAALRDGDLDALGPLMLASHASLRDDFEVSNAELDLLVDLLVEAGALGARLTGAGFGGCVVGLVRKPRAADLATEVTDRYRAATGLEPVAFTVRAADGAGPLPVPDAARVPARDDRLDDAATTETA